MQFVRKPRDQMKIWNKIYRWKKNKNKKEKVLLDCKVKDNASESEWEKTMREHLSRLKVRIISIWAEVLLKILAVKAITIKIMKIHIDLLY